MRAVISKLQLLAFTLFKWFEKNYMRANPGRSHILLSNKKTEKLKIKSVVFTSSFGEKLLGITLDSELKLETFFETITYICIKPSQIIYILSRITSHMSLNKQCLFMETFVEFQFNYCPSIGMFHFRRLRK